MFFCLAQQSQATFLWSLNMVHVVDIGNRFFHLLRATFIFILCLWGGTYPAYASKTQELKDVERQLSEAKARFNQLTSRVADEQERSRLIQQRLAQAAASQQVAELEFERIEQQISLLSGKEQALIVKISEDEGSVYELLSAIATFERQRPPSLAVHGQDSSQALRAALIMSATVPALKERASDLSVQLEKLINIRQTLRERRESLNEAQENRAKKAAELRAMLMARKEREILLKKEAEQIKKVIDQLGSEATDLRDLIAKLNQAIEQKMLDLPAGEALSFSAQGRSLLVPVIGRISGRYGQKDESGTSIWGIKYKAQNKAVVVAPYDGVVEYAGIFKGYGRLVILNIGGGYHVIMSGIEGLDVDHRQVLISGEPIGVMGLTSHEELYFELRHKGKPVDPSPFLGGPVSISG